MIPNRIQQEHLADFAPKQSLDKYSKGADPRVISGIIALDEMKQQAAMRERANLANGAASGQMPTVRDKIMALFQQSNPQQAQMQPNPLQQGIMAQARPQMRPAPMPDAEAPFEAYSGGVARLPVSDDMFGYAGGGIIAFKKGDEVPKAEETDDATLSPEVAADIKRRMEERTAEKKEPSSESKIDSGIKKALAFASAPFAAAADVAALPINALRRFVRNPLDSSEKASLTPFSDYRSEYLQDGSAPTKETTSTASTTNRPQLQGPITRTGEAAAEHNRLEKAYQASQTSDVSQAIERERERLESQGKKMTPDDVRAITARFAQAAQNTGIAQNTGAPGAPARPAAAKPPGGPTAPPSAAPPSVDQLITQQQQLLKAANAPVGPQLPEKSITDKATDFLKAQEDYVKKTGDSEAAKKLSSLYDKMEKRALADDDAQAAQRAADARSNLWSFLSNTRGSSLAVAAGRADAALQPLLSEQKKANAEYRKYSYERDMSREKARVEAIAAEDARKRGDFAKAIEHEQKERTYRLEAKKADDVAQHYRNTEANQLLQIQATRESSKEGHATQLEVARINKAAQLAGFTKPSEAERVGAEYRRILKEQGQKAADAFLTSEEKIRAAVGGVKYEGQDKTIQNRAKVYDLLSKDEAYKNEQDQIRRLEAKQKRTPKEEARLSQARTYVQNRFNEVHKGLYGTEGDGGGGAAPQRVTTQEEYSKLPSGTRFVAPDGSIRVKP